MAHDDVHIGTSGYQYDHWRGVLYPEDLPKRRWFAHYAEHFDTVEINNTFYNLPDASTFDAWHDAAPAGFRFALKMSRYLTHMKKLRDPEEPVERFLERAERLKSFLGPILVQLPPQWNRDAGRLRGLLEILPRRHRWAVELRDHSWLHEETYQALADHDAALVLHDMLDDHPRVRTADFVYQRWHGDHYAGSYSPQKLGAEARWLRAQHDEGAALWVFFDNDEDGGAVGNARDLRRFVHRD